MNQGEVEGDDGYDAGEKQKLELDTFKLKELIIKKFRKYNLRKR